MDFTIKLADIAIRIHSLYDEVYEMCRGKLTDAPPMMEVTVTPEDIVVTQDIGLADIVLGRGAHAIGVRGRIYNPLTIDSMMFIRHEEKKVRRQGGRTKGPAPFTNEDRKRFERNLRQLVHEAKQPQSKSID